MTGPQQRATADVLADAIRVLTEAARLRRVVLARDETASAAAGQPVWAPTGRTEQADWAEFVTMALAGAAANFGGVEAILAGRPGSWEADGVYQLLASTVGHEQQYLWEHRTEPLMIDVYVDEILADTGVWTRYDDAQQEIYRRYQALGLIVPAGAVTWDPLTDEQEAQLDALAELEEQVEQLREKDWAAYGQALKANVEAAAGRVEGLTVPVVVNVDLTTYRASREYGDSYGLVERILEEAITATPPPDERPPLDRLAETPPEPEAS